VSDQLCVDRIVRRVFDGDSAEAANPALREFLEDLVAAYRLPLRDDLLDQARGHSYTEMALALATDLGEAPLDLLIVTHAMPDVIPGRSTATYLGYRLPGNPVAFAICDQGSAAAFTALSIVSRYQRAGRPCGARALVLVLEQAALHYDADPLLLPREHVGVAMLLSDHGPVRVGPPRQHAGVTASQLEPLLAREMKELDPDGDLTIVVSASLADHVGPVPLPDGAEILPAGQPMTAIWSRLAAAITTATTTADRLILVDYDPVLRYLCLLPARIQPCS
jgi:4-hydroxymandelate oxidase